VNDIKQRVILNVKEALLELLAGHVDALVYPQPVLMKLAIEAGLEGRLKVLNAMNKQLWLDLWTALRDAGDDLEIKVVVITDAGRAFSTGDDISGAEAARIGLVN